MSDIHVINYTMVTGKIRDLGYHLTNTPRFKDGVVATYYKPTTKHLIYVYKIGESITFEMTTQAAMYGTPLNITFLFGNTQEFIERAARVEGGIMRMENVISAMDKRDGA